MKGSRIIFFGPLVLFLLMTLSSLFVETNTQDVRTWLAGGSDIRKDYDQYIEWFGNDDVILIAWDGCTIDDPRLIELEQRLSDTEANEGLIEKVTHGRAIMDQLVADGKSRRNAVARLYRVFIGSDQKSTCLTVALSEKGHTNRRAVVQRIRKIVDEYESLEWSELYLTGPAYVGVMIDRETNRSIWYAIPACSVGLLVTWFFVRRWRLMLPIMFTAGLAAISSVGILVATGGKLNGLLVLMPTLVAVLAVSGSIHLVNYFQDELATFGWRESVQRARRVAIRPCSLSVLTTSIAISSLCTSNIQAVRMFGFYSAISLLAALAFILLVLPAWLVVLKPRRRDLYHRFVKNDVGVAMRLNPLWDQITIRNMGLFICLVMLVVFGWGITQTESALDSKRLFRPDSDVLKGISWYEENLTGRDGLELLIEIPKQPEAKLTDELTLVGSVQRVLAQDPDVVATFSAFNFYGPVPDGYRFAQVARRQSIEKQLADRERLRQQKFRTTQNGHGVWRIHVALKEIDSQDYPPLLDRIVKAIESDERLKGKLASVKGTGMIFLAANSQQQLFDELFRSYSLAFLIITPVMMLVLRSFFAGLFAMLPNLAPTVVVFGFMGLSSTPVAIGAILTATVGLGIAVDDTLHFLCWHEAYSRDGESNVIGRTVSKCFRPMVQTSLICGTSLICFYPAEFVPVRQFAVTIAVLLGLALFFDLVFLPMILASPLGYFFKKRRSERRSA